MIYKIRYILFLSLLFAIPLMLINRWREKRLVLCHNCHAYLSQVRSNRTTSPVASDYQFGASELFS